MKPLIAFIIGLIAAPILLALVGVIGVLPSNAIATPPSIETRVMGRILDGSLEKRAKGLKNPIAANDLAALAGGGKIYADNCSGCHGDAKGPSGWESKGMYPRVPQFFEGQASDLTPEEAYAAIHDGIRYSGMGAWSGQMSQGDMWKVANFVVSIHGKTGAEKDED
jgi:mono/diheme cytochrome c family protein